MHNKLFLANLSMRSNSLVEKNEIKNKCHCYEAKLFTTVIYHRRIDT